MSCIMLSRLHQMPLPLQTIACDMRNIKGQGSRLFRRLPQRPAWWAENTICSAVPVGGPVSMHPRVS